MLKASPHGLPRKQAGLHVSDRIDLWVATGSEIGQAVEANRERVVEAVLAVSFQVVATGSARPSGWDHFEATDLDGVTVDLGLRRAQAQ